MLVMGVLGQAWPPSGAPEAFLPSPSPGFLDWPFIRGVNTTPFPAPTGLGCGPNQTWEGAVRAWEFVILGSAPYTTPRAMLAKISAFPLGPGYLTSPPPHLHLRNPFLVFGADYLRC